MEREEDTKQNISDSIHQAQKTSEELVTTA